MAIKLKLSADEHKTLPVALQSEYKAQADGSFVLDWEGVDGLVVENVTELKSALSKERTGHAEARKLAEAFKDLDPVKAREAITKFEEMKNWKPDDKVREQIAAIKSELDGKLKTETETRDKRIGFLVGELNRILVSAAAREALAQHGVTDSADLLLPHVERSLRAKEVDGKFVTRVVDDQGNDRITGESGKSSEMSVKEFVGTMKADNRFKVAFPADNKKAGSGAAGGGNGAKGTGDRATMTGPQKIAAAMS